MNSRITHNLMIIKDVWRFCKDYCLHTMVVLGKILVSFCNLRIVPPSQQSQLFENFQNKAKNLQKFWQNLWNQKKIVKMSFTPSRSGRSTGRAETRSRTKDDVRRVMQAVDKVKLRWNQYMKTIIFYNSFSFRFTLESLL